MELFGDAVSLKIKKFIFKVLALNALIGCNVSVL